MSIASAPLFQRLLARSPFSDHELIVLVATAASRYKIHHIKKRGGRGSREIAQPTKEVKFLQRLVVSEELKRMPVHDAAVAYRSGRSILDHAQSHAAARYLLKLDFTNFFPSLKWRALEHRVPRCRLFRGRALDPPQPTLPSRAWNRYLPACDRRT